MTPNAISGQLSLFITRRVYHFKKSPLRGVCFIYYRWPTLKFIRVKNALILKKCVSIFHRYVFPSNGANALEKLTSPEKRRRLSKVKSAVPLAATLLLLRARIIYAAQHALNLHANMHEKYQYNMKYQIFKNQSRYLCIR